MAWKALDCTVALLYRLTLAPLALNRSPLRHVAPGDPIGNPRRLPPKRAHRGQEREVKAQIALYNSVRPHQGLGNVPIDHGPPGCAAPPQEAVTTVDPEKIACMKSCGGLLKHYVRNAA